MAEDTTVEPDRPARFRDVLAVGEFRVLWAAYAISVAGDQLARVALTVLVFDHTHSPGWTAATYAMTFLPDLAGGPLLTGLADRFPRKRVMVTADVLRACLVAAMVVPGEPLGALVVLLVAAQLLASPSNAARLAVLPAVLPGDRMVVGTSLMSTTYQVALVGGFGGGAALVTAWGTGTALGVDAATFAVSAVLITTGVRAHRPSGSTIRTAQTWWSTVRAGFGLVTADRRLRSLVALACVCGAYVVPEGLAVPYAAQIHGGPTVVGLLLAANPAGTVVGVLVVKSQPAARRLRLLGPLAIATCAVLLPTALAPGVVVSVALWAASGVASSYNTIANATFVQTAPDHARGQAVGLASSAIRVAQGIGVVVAGLIAEVLTPAIVIGLAGVVGVTLAALASVTWRRAVSPRSAAAGA
ncbi:MAG TPA: MFS transporter [Pseudonocardiaceae bacterium]|nr:MFS transporter [Pseudonocardiaceae bacterium]